MAKARKARKRRVAQCKRGVACGRSCVSPDRQCARKPPYTCTYNGAVLGMGSNVLVLDATCQGKRQAVRFAPYSSEASLMTYAKLSRDAQCSQMVVPLSRAYAGRKLKLSKVLRGADTLKGTAGKRLREIEARDRQQIQIMDVYDIDATQLLLARGGSKKNRVVGRTPKQLALDYVNTCSHPSGYVHGDLYPRNVVMKKRTVAGGGTEYYDARLIDFDKLKKLPTKPRKRKRTLRKLAKRVQSRKGW